MEETFLQNYFAKWKTKGLAFNSLVALSAFIGGVVVLVFTFWFTYAVIFIGWRGVSAVSELLFSKRLSLSHHARLIGSGIFIVLLFIQHFRTNPWYYGDYPRRNYASSPVLQANAGLAGAFAFMLAYPGASANMITDILMSGPRLVIGSWGMIRRTFQIKNFDAASCSQVIGLLFQREKCVPYDEMIEAGWEPWFNQLRLIEGVNFLEKGICLSDELRNELKQNAPL